MDAASRRAAIRKALDSDVFAGVWDNPTTTRGKLQRGGFRDELQKALIADGANNDAARLAANVIMNLVAVYVGGPRFPEGGSAARVKKSLEDFVLAVINLNHAFDEMNPEAAYIVQRELFAASLFGPPALRTRLKKQLTTSPAPEQAMGYTYKRLHRVVRAMAKPALHAYASFHVKTGPRTNADVDTLLEGAIVEWHEATNDWSSTTSREGDVSEPLLTIIQNMVRVVTDDFEGVLFPISDTAYLRASDKVRTAHAKETGEGNKPRRRRKRAPQDSQDGAVKKVPTASRPSSKRDEA